MILWLKYKASFTNPHHMKTFYWKTFWSWWELHKTYAHNYSLWQGPEIVARARKQRRLLWDGQGKKWSPQFSWQCCLSFCQLCFTMCLLLVDCLTIQYFVWLLYVLFQSPSWCVAASRMQKFASAGRHHNAKPLSVPIKQGGKFVLLKIKTQLENLKIYTRY